MSVLRELFVSNRVVGVVGNRNSGKSSLVLGELIKLREYLDNRNDDDVFVDDIVFDIYVFGVEDSLREYLELKGLKFLYSKSDILDLELKNCVVFVDEVASFFSTQARDRETQRFKNFVNRVAHNNCWFVLGTAEVGWFNKLACSLINGFLVKRVDFVSLVNGTVLKRVVMGLEGTSEYRLDIPVSDFFVVGGGLVSKHSYDYDVNLDSKRGNVNPFKEGLVKKGK